MIPTIEQIVSDLLVGKITREEAIRELKAHVNSDASFMRDQFAIVALQGGLAAQGTDTGEWTANNLDVLAERCYSIADAMMKARSS